MPEKYECPECGNSYDSERGLHIHIGQKHPDKKEDILSQLEEEGKGEESEKSAEKTTGFMENFKEPLVSKSMKIGLAVLVLIIIGAFLFFGGYINQGAVRGEMTPTKAGKRAANFIGSLPSMQGAEVSLVNASDTDSGVYRFNLQISARGQTRTLTNYITEDGKLIFPNAEESGKVEGLSAEEAGEKAARSLSQTPQLQQSNVTVEFLASNGMKSGVYEVVLKLTAPQGMAQNLTSYVTTDGKYVFPQGINITKQMNALREQQQTQDQNQQQPQAENITNETETPTAELFVMSFCPYGNRGEKTMEKVYELLGDKVNWEPHYIVRNTESGLQSLHGQKEVEQDKREICVLKENGVGKWFDFVTYVDDNCGSSGECWQKAADTTGLEASKISTCAEERGTKLLKEEAEIANSKGATGSPTLIINGQESRVVYQYGNPEAYKDVLCSAFTNPPEACSQTLSSSGSSTPSGQC